MAMRLRWCALAAAALGLMLVAVADESNKPLVRTVKGKKVCVQGWECGQWSQYCCNHTISDLFHVYQFESLFPERNAPVAHAVGFWDYSSFITAAAGYEPLGFGTTGGKLMQMKEVAAFLGHVGSRTPCGFGVGTGSPFTWGLCFNREMSPSQSYCDESFKFDYPCSPGAEYYGRGALPIYWNYNYGAAGEALNVDLLNQSRIHRAERHSCLPGCNMEVDDAHQEDTAFSPRDLCRRMEVHKERHIGEAGSWFWCHHEHPLWRCCMRSA